MPTLQSTEGWAGLLMGAHWVWGVVSSLHFLTPTDQGWFWKAVAAVGREGLPHTRRTDSVLADVTEHVCWLKSRRTTSQSNPDENT